MIVTFIVLFAGGADIKHLFGIVAPVLGVAAVGFIFVEPYRRERLLNFTNPWKDPTGDGYQLIQSFYALGAGGLQDLVLVNQDKKHYICQNHIMILYFL